MKPSIAKKLLRAALRGNKLAAAKIHRAMIQSWPMLKP